MKVFPLMLLLTNILFISCKEDCTGTQKEIQSLMKDWYKKKISFPNATEILMDSTVMNSINTNTNNQSSNNFMVVHFFTADCDKCVNELLKIQSSLAKISKDANIDFKFIASAPTKIYVLDAIKKIKFPYPIYYEKHYYSFKTMNKLPLSDDLYNTMLINKSQEVVLFGAFYDNKKAERLFFKAIECGL